MTIIFILWFISCFEILMLSIFVILLCVVWDIILNDLTPAKRRVSSGSFDVGVSTGFRETFHFLKLIFGWKSLHLFPCVHPLGCLVPCCMNLLHIFGWVHLHSLPLRPYLQFPFWKKQQVEECLVLFECLLLSCLLISYSSYSVVCCMPFMSFPIFINVVVFFWITSVIFYCAFFVLRL